MFGKQTGQVPQGGLFGATPEAFQDTSIFKKAAKPSIFAANASGAPQSFGQMPDGTGALPRKAQKEENPASTASKLLNKAFQEQFAKEGNFRFLCQTLLEMPASEPNHLLCLVVDDAK